MKPTHGPYIVRTGRENQPVTGFDSMIAAVPDEVYATVGDLRALVVNRVGALLRTLSEQGAASVGTALHHAEWVITTAPEEVRTRGEAHCCDQCHAGCDTALAYLRDNPGKELMVGTLYWTDP